LKNLPKKRFGHKKFILNWIYIKFSELVLWLTTDLPIKLFFCYIIPLPEYATKRPFLVKGPTILIEFIPYHPLFMGHYCLTLNYPQTFKGAENLVVLAIFGPFLISLFIIVEMNPLFNQSQLLCCCNIHRCLK